MQIIEKKISELKPYEKNPRRNDNAVDYVAKSIEQFGFKVPIVIDSNGIVVCGHTRMKAAKKLGLKTVPCIIADDLTDEQIKAFRLADNKTAEFAEWDFDLLNDELDGIFDIDMGDFGFDSMDFGSDGEKEIVEDEPPEIDENSETICKFGDIWQLGNHRLMCGDSTDREQVERLMNGEKADMVFTDPPYDMEMGGQGCFKKQMQNCKDRIDDIIRFDPYVLSYLPKLDINSFYIFTSKNGVAKYLDIFKDLNYDILCWCKTNPVPFTSGKFLPDVEYLLYFSRSGRIWNNFLKPTSVYRKYYVTQKLQGRVDAGENLHPTMKPIEIIVDKIRINSNDEGIVVDLFGGSGSTMIACEQLDRKCYMMELSEKYCDVIIKRWENFTGKKAVKIDETAN